MLLTVALATLAKCGGTVFVLCHIVARVDDSDDIIQQRPVLAIAAIVVIATVAYAVISLVMNGSVDPIETVVFAVAFAVVYSVFAFYSERIEGLLGRN